MVPRFRPCWWLLLLGATTGCGADVDVYFEPLSSAGSAGAPIDGNREPSGGTASTTVEVSTSGGASGSDGAQAGAATENAGASGGGRAGASGGGQAGATTENAGTNSGGRAGAMSTGGRAGAASSDCETLEPWSSRPYVLGERVSSLCQAPYGGACPAGERHEFECRPATGTVGLGWCSTRQPGVGNGWHEAWLLETACPN